MKNLQVWLWLWSLFGGAVHGGVFRPEAGGHIPMVEVSFEALRDAFVEVVYCGATRYTRRLVNYYKIICFLDNP